MPASPRSCSSSAGSTSWSAMPASRSCIASRNFPYAEWKKLIAIHLDGAFLTVKACLPHMYKKKSGSIIFMGSVHSQGGLAAQIGLCGGQARHPRPCPDDRKGRRPAMACSTNVICPGFVQDAAGREADPRTGARSRHQRGRGGEEGDARQYGGPALHHRRGCRRSRADACGFPEQCADRPVDRRQPWLEYELSRTAAMMAAWSTPRRRCASSLGLRNASGRAR